MKTLKTLSADLPLILKQIKLRPHHTDISDPLPFKDKPGTFIMVSFYWDELYFDTLQFSPKIEQLKTLVNDYVKTLPKYKSIEWGASDGHLFLSLSFVN